MASPNFSTLTPDALIGRIQARLESRKVMSRYSEFNLAPQPAERAAYALVVGAGFSCGVVPLVRELMHETIGGYYFPAQDETSLERPPSVLKKNAAAFWAELNQALTRAGLAPIEVHRADCPCPGKEKVGREGLPCDPGAAYQSLFTYEGANALLSLPAQPTRGGRFMTRLLRERGGVHGTYEGVNALPSLPAQPARGERFMKGFLRYVMDPGGEHGWGSTGRNRLNGAHLFLAALLEAQQRGDHWGKLPFCRTVFTTNFDTLLQNALQMVNLLYRITDRPERGLDPADFAGDEEAIHLVYTHGSILRHNPASAVAELDDLSHRNTDVLHGYLESVDVITIGYSGWNDGLMAALRRTSRSQIYWCGVQAAPPPHVASFLSERSDRAAYVCLGDDGADPFMRTLYEALVPEEGRRDPFQRYQEWSALVWKR